MYSNNLSISRASAYVLAAVVGTSALTGCFATQADIRVLQSDLNLVRNEAAASDSARKIQLDGVIRTMRAVSDSMVELTNRMTRFRADMTGSVASIEQQLLSIQELTGQSQRKLQEMRASLEERQQAQAQATPPGATTGSAKLPGVTTPLADSTPVDDKPGPNQLFQIGREQLMQGSYSTARTAFEDLLSQYPKSDIAGDAQFYVAETYAAEGETKAADSVYARVAARYPSSPRAATAVFKRATIALTAGKTDTAKKLFNDVIKKYPRSDEAALARDRVKALEQ